MNRRSPSGRLGPPHGVDGTSSSEHSRQRPGDGESPGVLSGAKITPEPPEERRGPTLTGRAEAGRPGCGSHERAPGDQPDAKEGGTAGPRHLGLVPSTGPSTG